MQIIFSTKSDGDLCFKTDHPELTDEIKANRIRFFEKNGIDPARLVNIAGVHGINIKTVTEDDIGSGALDPDTRIRDTDGLITNVSNSYLMVTGADCFAVLLWDDAKNIIGALHGGWKGIQSGIVKEMIGAFRNRFNSDAKDIKAWIGPGIKSCHYDIPAERNALFEDQYKAFIIERDEKTFLDLPGIIKAQLKENGVNSANITEHPDCTYCKSDTWFSFRREGRPEKIQAAAFIIHQE